MQYCLEKRFIKTVSLCIDYKICCVLCGILFATPAKNMWSLWMFGNRMAMSIYVNVFSSKRMKEK